MNIIENKKLMQYWDKKENEKQGFSPDKISINSKKVLNWTCEKRHKWKRQASVQNRVKNPCPFCSGLRVTKENSLGALYPQLLLDWDDTKNNLDYFNISPGSAIKIWWKCHICGYEWQTKISHRTKDGTGCPACANKRISLFKLNCPYEKSLENLYPSLLKEWDYNKNEKQPSQIYAHSTYLAWWICEYGHHWQAEVNARTRKNASGCPECLKRYQTSFPEQCLYYYFSQVTKTINRDLSFGKELDIYLPELKIGIEYNGSFYHKNKEKDIIKKNFFKEKGIKIFFIQDSNKKEITEDYIYYEEFHLEEMLQEIFKKVNLPCPQINLEKDKKSILNQYLFDFKEKSLLAKVPEVVYQWDYEKNYPLRPEQFSPSSRQEVCWHCERGHSWKQTIGTKIHKNKNKEYFISQCQFCFKNRYKTFSEELEYKEE